MTGTMNAASSSGTASATLTRNENSSAVFVTVSVRRESRWSARKPLRTYASSAERSIARTLFHSARLLAWKLPIYLAFIVGRQRAWVLTPRDVAGPGDGATAPGHET